MKLTEKNLEKLQQLLDQAQGKATARTLDAHDLLDLADRAEARLAELGLCVADRKGARVAYHMGLNLPNSYKFCPEYTTARIGRRATGWFLEYAKRTGGSNKQAERLDVTLTAEQRDRALEWFQQQFNVAG